MGSISGTCKKCGTPEIIKWAKARNINIMQSNGHSVELSIPQICLNYRSDGKCNIHENKPAICKDYPHPMLPFWEKCGMNPAISLGAHCGFKYKSED